MSEDSRHLQRPLLVLGARQYAPVFADVFEGVNGYNIVGFVENLDPSLCGDRIFDLPVHWVDDIVDMARTHSTICCLATVERDEFIRTVERLGFEFATLAHPTAWVSSRSTLAPGASLDVGVVVAGFTHIGAHARIGRRATVGHHSRIGDFSTLHPACNVAGNCLIGAKVTLGMGAIVIDGCTVGTGSFVAAGAVVTKDVPSGVVVAGTPARVVRELSVSF